MRIATAPTKKARIDMIPLMDSIFLLLVFFVYAMITMVVQQGLPVNLPAASSAEVQEIPPIAITITADGQYFINQEPVANLQARLEQQNPETPIIIQADTKAQHGQVIQVLDVLRQEAFKKVSFETQ